MDFLRLYKHLLPRARAWRITIEKTLRAFFVGLSSFPDAVREFLDDVYLDLFPQSTRALDEWENEFALPATAGLTTQQRRDRLAATWQAQGGQDPRYIQDTLQAAGFPVFLHEWWEPGSEPAIDVHACAIPRNPSDFLTGGAPGSNLNMFDGQVIAQDGGLNSQDGATNSPVGYPLVNKIFSQAFLSDGAPAMQDGGALAQDGHTVGFFARTYQIPTDPAKWSYFLYIGGATFPGLATVPSTRRDEFEDLCLKICPAHLWLGILVNYN